MLGESYWDRDFIMPNEAICRTLPREEFVMYERGARVMPVEAETLMDSVEPWFNREGHFFCSHQHAPSTGRMGFPAVTRHGGVVYCSHPLFTIYRDFAPAWVKAMVNDILDLLVPDRLVRKVGERTISGLELQLRRAPGGGALLLHCLWYPVKKQASRLFTIDERVALHNQRVRVRIGDVSRCDGRARWNRCACDRLVCRGWLAGCDDSRDRRLRNHSHGSCLMLLAECEEVPLYE